MTHRLAGLIVVFAVLSALFWGLQRLWPGVRGQRLIRAGYGTDCLYWLWTALVTKSTTAIAVGVALLPLALLYGTDLKTLVHGHGRLTTMPLWLQGIAIFIAGDFLGYWQHRLFHGRTLWRFHAVHHSSTELDWLSSVRLHPVNQALARVLVAVPLVAAGFNATAVALYAPFTTFYAIMIHANLDWDYGPLRYVIASPVFHRWHHAKTGAGQGRNFSGGLPIWDLLFGTFYMPCNERPYEFGIAEAMPNGFIGQMIHPFRKTPPQVAVAETAR